MSKLVGVLFADISGSTRLYDTLGDAQAKRMIDECLDVMRAASARYGGRVVKTIGDEVDTNAKAYDKRSRIFK